MDGWAPGLPQLLEPSDFGFMHCSLAMHRFKLIEASFSGLFLTYFFPQLLISEGDISTISTAVVVLRGSMDSFKCVQIDIFRLL